MLTLCFTAFLQLFSRLLLFFLGLDNNLISIPCSLQPAWPIFTSNMHAGKPYSVTKQASEWLKRSNQVYIHTGGPWREALAAVWLVLWRITDLVTWYKQCREPCWIVFLSKYCCARGMRWQSPGQRMFEGNIYRKKTKTLHIMLIYWSFNLK